MRWGNLRDLMGLDHGKATTHMVEVAGWHDDGQTATQLAVVEAAAPHEDRGVEAAAPHEDRSPCRTRA